MSYRMIRSMKKYLASLLCMTMIFSLLPALSVKADVTNNLWIASDDFDKADVFYTIGNGVESNLSSDSSDHATESGIKGITTLTDQSVIKIRIAPKDGRSLRVNVKEGFAGDSGEAYGGAWDGETNTYTFTCSANGQDPRDYVIKFEETNPNPDPGEGGSWEDSFTQYFEPGINILSSWVGNSQGDITYAFSTDNSTYGDTTTLTRSQVEESLSVLSNTEASEDAKATAKQLLFGLNSVGSKFIKLKTGKDLGGNHLGFEIYAKDEQGNWKRDDNSLSQLRYWSYRDKNWKDFSDATNREWEDYLKNSEAYDPDANQDVPIDGLVIDISGLDLNTYAIRCHLPFDSRKNVSWWNAKYRGEVEAAGDYVSEDSWVENGTVELIKVASEDGSEIYYSDEEGWTADPNVDPNMVVKLTKAGYDMGNGVLRPGYTGAHGEYSAEQMLKAAEKASGQCNIPENTIATFRLTPDAGYQILAAQINGMPLTPDAGSPSTFSFKITSNIHFSAMFEETANVVDVEASRDVSAANIAGTSDVVDSGNIALTVTDDSEYDNTDALEIVNGEALASLNIEVDQIIAKAGNLSEDEQTMAKEGTLSVTEDKFWKNNLTDLNSPVDIELVLTDITVENNEELTLVRDHNGKCEEIPLNVKVEEGQTVASFSSEKFSTYTIIKKSLDDDNLIPTVSRKEAENFINRMYGTILGRTSDEEGLNYWCDGLVNQSIDAAGITNYFFFSDEYKAKNRSDEEYLDDLYQTVLGRKADASGKAFWLDCIKNGQSRTVVMACFVNSNEFSEICDEFGIPRGTMEDDGSSICNGKVRQFILRNYAKTLKRKGETSGVEYWCYLINKNKITPAQVAEYFFTAEEFKNKNLSDADFVETLYETFFDRSSDAEGKEFWLTCLKNGATRDEVMDYFSDSSEFSKIVASFGL